MSWIGVFGVLSPRDLGALSWALVGLFLSWVPPLIIMLRHRDSAFVRQHASTELQLQAPWLAVLVGVGGGTVAMLYATMGFGPLAPFMLLFAVVVIPVVGIRTMRRQLRALGAARAGERASLPRKATPALITEARPAPPR